jgi:hypothetical protein
MDEEFKEVLGRLVEFIANKRVVCSPQFVADIAELESIIRELEIENNVNRLRLLDLVNKSPESDRFEIGELLASQVN